MMKLQTRWLVSLVLAVLFLGGGCATTLEPTASASKQANTVIFLVRHAEKVKDGSRDPALSPAGQVRAQVLAKRLAGEKIKIIHSTDYQRTRDTAAPFAQLSGLTVRLYDPRALEGFANALKQQGGRHLVVGHSNTTPALVGLLGGDPEGPIDEPAEYDRLYIVTIGPDGRTRSTLQRYGAAYIPAN